MPNHSLGFENLPPALKRAKYEVEWFMTEVCGLEPFFTHPDGKKSQVIFEMCDTDLLYSLAAYGGFPIRYPHYSFGLEYNEMLKSHEYGLSKIYEMVINNDPCYAYLLRENALIDHKLVMAHVYAHADFFVNNAYFAHTNRKAVDMMANHGVRIQAFADEYGAERVEEWLDVVRSLDNLIDPDADGIRRVPEKKFGPLDSPPKPKEPWDGRLPASTWMEDFINPTSELEKVEKKNEAEEERKVQENKTLLFPAEPVRDVMGFLATYAPLEPWQREIIWMLREESLYFQPQARTKILNEGWASLWHSIGMTQLASASEIIDYADHNSGTLALSPGRLNPYPLGKALYLDAWHRWDTHRRGEIYSKCELVDVKNNWDAFVAFFNIFVDLKDEPVSFDMAWQEFLYFWHRLKEGAIGISKDFFDQQKLLLWWSYYAKLNDKLGEAQLNLLRNGLRVADLSHQLDNLKTFNRRISLAELIDFHVTGLEDELQIEEVVRKVTLDPSKFVTTAFLSSILTLDRAGFNGELLLSPEVIDKTRLKFEERLEYWRDHIRPHLEGKVKFFLALEVIKKEFASGAKAPTGFFEIPKEFFDWAERFVNEGRLEIGLGLKKIFEIRKVHCDLTGLDELLTPEIALRMKLFKFDYKEDGDLFVIASRQFDEVKRGLLFSLANRNPRIVVKDANFKNKRILLLEHQFPEMELKSFEAQKTLENLYKVWQRPVCILTEVDGDKMVWGYTEGKHFQEKV